MDRPHNGEPEQKNGISPATGATASEGAASDRHLAEKVEDENGSPVWWKPGVAVAGPNTMSATWKLDMTGPAFREELLKLFLRLSLKEHPRWRWMHVACIHKWVLTLPTWLVIKPLSRRAKCLLCEEWIAPTAKDAA